MKVHEGPLQKLEYHQQYYPYDAIDLGSLAGLQYLPLNSYVFLP
jgi:hypothetical protein